MILIGLTGTIGSGKSVVAEMLRDLGAEIVDTDVIAREVVEPGTPGLAKLVGIWGDGILKSDGTLHRERLAEIVFANEDERRRLNSILHPMIAIETQKRVAAAKSRIVVMVVPLLFESGMDRLVNLKWVVTADDDVLAHRICTRDGCTPDHARDRIRTQMSKEEKIARSDTVIDNSGSLDDTRRNVEEAYAAIEKL